MRSFALAAACLGLALSSGCSMSSTPAASTASGLDLPVSAPQAVMGRAMPRPIGPSSSERPAAKSNYKLLYAFQGTPDGASPEAGLAELNGTLYGTTLNGSTNYCSASCGSNDCYLGCGTVFSVSESGKENVIYNFQGNFNNAGDGTWPFDALTEVNGTFYGTTSGGGGPADHGTIFSVTPQGGEHRLYSFAGGTDGEAPEASLVNVNGTLYGTTLYGGGSGCGGSGCGTVFTVTPSGSEHVVYSFQGGTDGANAYSGVTAMGNMLYGATLFGGAGGCGSRGCGTIYSLNAKGKERVLYRFTGTTDGGYPNGLIAYKKALYGTTEGGGSRSSGTFFTVSKSGTEKVLYNFLDIPDGNLPGANLIEVNGTFYSTTVGGGTQGVGSVFSVTPGGAENVLYSFLGGSDGSAPNAPVVAVKNELYGTTYTGGGTGCGGSGCGTIFKVKL
jgi:uncharacterized repeat protein (TIGR03803 family)